MSLDKTKIYHDLITSIVTALEAKDQYTADHSQRVSDMTEQICRLLRLPDEDTEAIHMAAHVHDIGKIGVPDAVLVKAGPLSDEEWSQIRLHPQIGAEILKKSTGLSEIADIVHHHHERWDGKGYPAGLKGSNIPLGSRIIAISDSIDAMFSKRLYRTMLTQKECCEEIRVNAGKMYDPQIVKVVLREWEQLMADYQRHDN